MYRPLGSQVSVCRQPRSLQERFEAVKLLLDKNEYPDGSQLTDHFTVSVDTMEDDFLEAFAAW